MGSTRPIVLLAWLISSALVASAQETGLPPAPTQPAGETLFSQSSVFVRDFRFEGNTAISTAELRAAVAPFVAKEITSEGLEEARRAVTELYISRSYINSGAILPDQNVKDGVVLLKVVEGRLTGINLTGNRRLRNSYIISRVRRAGSTPLNIVKLKNQLELIRQDPNLTRVNAELRPGAAPGESYLDLSVEEANPFQLGLQFSNRRPPSVGAEQFEALASDRNLTGNGDTLALRYGINRGGIEHFEFAGARDFSLDYTLPVSPSDTTVAASFSRTDAPVVEEPFQDLDITSDSKSFALTLRQPFYRTPATEFAMFLSGGYRQNKTFLLGKPFSFSSGDQNGRSVVSAIRFGQEFTTRDQIQAFSARSTFGFGVNLFNATINSDDNVPDGQFVDWLGQVQYVRRLGKSDNQLVFRLSGQLTDSPLLSIEQFAIGGFDTVRGYRENQIIRDNGLVSNIELHIPLLHGKGGYSMLDLVPFYDLGYGWNQNQPNGQPGSAVIHSVGVGLQYTPNRHVNAQLFYGYALRDRPERERNLQDVGIHFNVLILAF